MSSGFIPKEKLSAYERWELGAFDDGKPGGLVPPAGEAPPADEAPAIALPTAEDVERIHNEAYASGHAAGLEAGRAAGHAEGLALAQAEAAQIAALGDNLRQQLQQFDQQVGETLLAVAVEIAAQVLRQSLRVRPELLLPIVREALAAMSLHNGHPALYLNPADAALVRTHLGEQLAHNGWRIIEDGSITAGGCRVEAGASEVDATLETRWRRVLEAIGTSGEWLEPKP
ncbi:flagellar assembly protein FliH [Azospira restricta]|uniref:Flagellar assembly protein FliH n=1 Tax=Azospira restricta TaxID=404405 RepID=A0A974SS55_9RHOO|nr:flagellar assembly protein FliH [Azospira restricta]QRJ65471.1 flagellar assembly protein FliH [Azospira restricta]